MRRFKKASVSEIMDASQIPDGELAESVQVLLEAGGYSPVIIRERNGKRVLGIKSNYMGEETHVEKAAFRDMMVNALEVGQILFEEAVAPIRRDESSAIKERNFRQAGEAKRYMKAIEKYL